MLRTPGRPWGQRHEVISLAFVPYVVPTGQEQLEDDVILVIASHHRDWGELHRLYDPDLEATLEHLERLVASISESRLLALQTWLHEFVGSWRGSKRFNLGDLPTPVASENWSAFQARAAVDIRRFLRRYFRRCSRLEERAPPEGLRGLFLRGTTLLADHSGSAHAGEFKPYRPPAASSLADGWRTDWGGLHAHQEAALRLQDSALLMAPTGSGKTETALLWAASAAAASSAPRLFYVLPFQASMNAMKLRLDAMPGQGDVALRHSRALQALYRQYLRPDDSAASAESRARAAAALARLHMPPVHVLSPYQLLKAFYRVRGYEAVLADAAGGLFVFDEIHAYEPKRLALILGMCGALNRRFDARFCFMSATFPAFLRTWLDEQVPNLERIEAAPETFHRFRRHRVRLVPGRLDEGSGLQRVVQAARSGLSVLVCCNRISRAQQVAELLRVEGVEVELLHGRFNARDRLRKEERVRGCVATTLGEKKQPMVLVATQVVEVSLDVDFDVLFTEPAPLDALLQRFGRINRGCRGLRDIYVFADPVEEFPYDPLLVQASVALLAREFGEPGAVIDESQVNAWIDSIYSGEMLARMESDFRTQLQEFEAVIVPGLGLLASEEALEREFYRAFDGIEVLPAALEAEHEELLKQEPLAASSLTVSLRWRQFARLKGSGRARDSRRDSSLQVVEAPYTGEAGLLLD